MGEIFWLGRNLRSDVMEAGKKQFAEKLQEMDTLMNGYFGQIAMRSAIREFFWKNKFFMGQLMKRASSSSARKLRLNLPMS